MIYLDYNATTPLDERVLAAMDPYLRGAFGNAASPHAMGCQAATAVERAREQVAALLAADPRELVFTSGATEANNLALFGVAESPHYERRARRIVTVRTEHAAVLDPCLELERRGFEVVRLPVDAEGRLDLEELRAAVETETLLVSVMLANNETGVLHPVETIGRVVRERGALFHCDATQAVGKEEIDVNAMSIDLLSLSAHKLYGPKGVGALFVRRRSPRVRVAPRVFGGGHERGMRSGTANVPGVVGLGAAAELARSEGVDERARIAGLRDALERDLLAIEGVTRNGPATPRLAGTSNLSFAGVSAKALMRRMPDVLVSTASACTTAAQQPSHVLGAMGLSDERIDGSLRFSLGRFTTADEVARAIAVVAAALIVERSAASPDAGTCGVNADR